MLRVLLSTYLLCAVAVLGMLRDHEEATREQLDHLEDLVNSLHANPAEAGRRELQQSWTQFNNYFSGTYWGRSPGPCNLEATKRNNNRCYARACKMSPAVRQIPVDVPLLGEKRLDQWINCDDCASKPGELWLWNTDFGNMRMGGIYLDIVNQDNNDQQAPPQGFAPTSSEFESEYPYYNQFRMVFTLSEAQFDMDSRVDIKDLQIKSLPIISTFTLSRDNVGVVLSYGDQPISSSQHGVSFRTTLIFRANRMCNFRSPRNPTISPQYLDTTCIYRSDEIRKDYYRGLNGQNVPTDRRTETFKEGIVYDVNLPRQGAMNTWTDSTPLDETQSCLWDFNNQYASSNRGAKHTTELGLKLDFGEICDTWLFGDPCRAVVNFLLNLIVGLIIKDLLCQLFTGMFYISNSGGMTGTRGVINIGLLTLYEKLRYYVELPLSSPSETNKNEDIDIPAFFRSKGYYWPDNNCASTSYCPYPVAVDFNTSDLFRSVSLGLNGILGNYSSTPGYTNKLTIVEVIDILTGNKEGALKLGLCPANAPPPTTTHGYPAGTCDGDIRDELGLEEYPRFEWTGEPIFDGAIQLNGLYLTGVNSITRLHILDNGFQDGQDTNPEYTHTLKNSFDMTRFGMLMDFWLTLKDGTWVHRPRNSIVPANSKRVIEMKTNVYIEIKNIVLDVDFFVLLRPDLLSNKKIGSIFGNWPDGNLMKRFNCASFGLDYFKLTKLQMRGVLEKLEFQNFAGDLGTVITQGTKVFNLGYKSATAIYLTFLSDNFMRRKLNEVFEAKSFDGPCGGQNANHECISRLQSNDSCALNYPYYFSPTDPNRHINFYDSKVWNLIKGVVNDVVGGIPVRTGSASINTIIDKYMDWYFPGTNGLLVKVPNTNSPAPGERGNFDSNKVVLLTADNATEGGPADDKFIEFSQFGVRNLETIHELSIRPTQQTQPRKFRVDFKLGDGKIWDRTNNVYIVNGLFTVKFHLKMEVTEKVNGDLTTYTEDEADIKLMFGNLTVGTDIFTLINQNEVLDLNFAHLTSAACLMALMDSFNMETLTIGFKKFRLAINRIPAWRHRDKYCATKWSVNACPQPNVPCAFVSTAWGESCSEAVNRKMRMSDAIDHLAWEAQYWGSTVDNMIQYFFNGIAESTRKGINQFYVPDIEIAGCESRSVLSGTPFAFLDRFFSDATEDYNDIFSDYQALTKDQWNPRFPMVNPSDPENTMYGSRSPPHPLAIDYAEPPNPALHARGLKYVGFPAADCDRVNLYGPYVSLSNDSCWEDKVQIEPTDTNFVNLPESFVVNEAQKFLAKSGRRTLIAALDALANTDGNFVGKMLISYPHGAALPNGRGPCDSMVDGEPSFCIDLDANLTEIGVKLDMNSTREGFIFYNDDFIPGLTIQATRLSVLNVHTFDAEPELFELLKPYIPNQYNFEVEPPFNYDLKDHSARFTLAHRIKFSGLASLAIQLELDISVEERFLSQTTLTPDRNITDTMILDFSVKNLDIQMMTMTAINQSRVEEVPFYYFLHPFDKEKCFFSIFYQNGLQFPQFQVYVSEIVGPDALLSAKSPPNVKPNIFSDGMRDVITAGIEMFAQMMREDLPDLTQGSFRSYLNRVLDGYVTSHRNAIGPGSCPLKPACDDPNSYCHYQKFSDFSFDPIFNTLNDVVGGNPIKTSQMDVNSLIELGLNYALISPNGLQLVEPGFIEHPKTGDWIVPSVLDYSNGDSLVRITNIGLRGLNSIYKLTFDRFTSKPYSLSFDIEAGEGQMLNGTVVPPSTFTSDPLVLQAELEVKVVAKRPGGINETLADNKFQVELVFSGVNVTALQEILFNKTDFYALNFNQITNSQCALSIIDKVTMETILMQIADFDVYLPDTCTHPSDTGCVGRNYASCGGQTCNLGKAIDTLRNDASGVGGTNEIEPPLFAKPTRMINVVLSQMGDSVVTGFNKIDIWNKPREKCDVPKVILTILAGVDNATHATQLQDRLINNVSQVLSYPRPLISPGFKSITVQSERLSDPVDRQVFIQELIEAARDARGGVPEPEVVLRQGSLCSEMNLPGYVEIICDAVMGGQSNFTSTLQEWTKQKRNLIESGVTPSDIEDRVRIDVTKESFYDIRTSNIVKMVSEYFDDKAPVIEELLLSLVNSSRGLLREQDDGGVTLTVNLTDALLYADQHFLSGKTCEGDLVEQDFKFQDLLGVNNFFIPGLRILPGLLEISNFGSFSELIVLKPYEVGGEKARFTTRHELGWRKENKPLGISVSIDLFYDFGFTHFVDIPSGMEEHEQINITMTVENLLVQVLTLLAVNTKELGEVRLGDFLNVDVTQVFKRNCKAATCLMRAIFDGGIYMPQFSINVTDIVGPKFTTSRNLFSEGMEQFVDAIIEIVVQLFRDDLAAITQGPIRDAINDAMIQTLTDSKKEGACPPRRNYTRDYPLGEFYCSHNDTTGANPLLTQSEAICRGKGNGRRCKWEPPDGEVTSETVACFYTQESRVLNFQASPGLQQLKTFINGSLMNPDSALYIKTYLGAFASNLSTDPFADDLNAYPIKYNGAEYGTVRMGIGRFTMVGLDSIDRLQIFDTAPYGPGGDAAFTNGEEYEPAPPNRRLLSSSDSSSFELEEMTGRRSLAKKVEFGYADNKYMSRTAFGWEQLTVGFEVLYAFDELFVPRVDGPQDFVENHIGVKFILTDFDFVIDLFMLINIPRLMDLQIRSIGTIYELPCILEIFEDNGLVPVHANITYGTVGFKVECVNRCDSPFFSPLKSGGFSDQTSGSLRDSFTQMFQRVTDFAIRFLASSEAQDFLDRQITISNDQCTAIKTGDIFKVPDTGEPHTTNAASAMGIAGLSTLFTSFVVFALLVPLHFRRKDELMKRALLDAHSRGTAGKSKDEFELAERRLRSAFDHPMIPVYIKYGVVVWILVNIIMFATANFAAAGAIVELTLSIAGDTTYPITLLPFTLERSINDMWMAGVYFLAFIIAIASGGWPYAKNILLLFSWFAPATVLHPRARGRLLEILDTLGKWSLIDMFVMVLLMVAFRFYISSSYVESFSLLPPDVLVVDVAVTPGWGLYGFVLGAMGTLLVNHVMIFHHRKLVRQDEDLQDAILGTLVKDLRTPRIPLSRHRFNILDAEGRPYRYSVMVRVMFVFSVVLTFFILLIGSVLPTLKFTFRGVAGIAISFIEEDLGSSTHSVVSIGTSLIDGARDTAESVLGILFMQILYILFALVIPLIMCLLLICIWLVPLTLREQLLLYFVAEILSAWEAVLVLVVSFVSCVLQVSQLAQFIVDAATGNLCRAVEGQLEKIFPDPEDAQCFNVIASFVPASSILILAGVLILITSAITFRLIHAAIIDRELAMRRKPPHSPGEMTGLTGFIVRRSLEAFGASQIQNGGSVANLFAKDQGAFDPRDSQLTPSNPILAREMPHSMSSMNTPNPLFHGSMGSVSKTAHMSIDV